MICYRRSASTYIISYLLRDQLSPSTLTLSPYKNRKDWRSSTNLNHQQNEEPSTKMFDNDACLSIERDKAGFVIADMVQPFVYLLDSNGWLLSFEGYYNT